MDRNMKTQCISRFKYILKFDVNATIIGREYLNFKIQKNIISILKFKFKFEI